jgi:hypothetical protein
MAALYPIHPSPCGVLHGVTYRRAMSHRLSAAAAAVVVLAVPAAAHAAPVLQPLKPCYVAVGVDPVTGYYVTEDVHVTASGFTPDAKVTVAIDGVAAAADVPVDAAGNVDTTVPAPFQARGRRAFTVAVTDQQDAAQTVSADTLVTRLEVWAKPRVARPTQQIRLTGGGFMSADRGIYAHYVRAKKVRRTVRLAARPSGPCGTFTAVRHQFPFKPRKGTWRVQVDQQRRYDPTPSTAFVTLKILVKRELLTGKPKHG